MAIARPKVARGGLFSGLHTGMSLASKAVVIAFVVYTLLNVDAASKVYGGIRSWIESTLGWYYILTMCVVLFVCIYLMCSRHGKVRLGSDSAKPEFSYFSWFAMLFSAGVGIGILFFSISEPMFYFDTSQPWGYPNNPHADALGATALDMNRAIAAMRVTYFHWGFHAWSVYAIVGLSLAYFAFRKGLPFTLRSSLYPVIGDRIYGPIGHAVDLLAIFGTVFGVATSLGLGVLQMSAGLEKLFGISPGTSTQLTLVAVISVIATISAVTGVGRGIRRISELNVILSVILLLVFLVGGPLQWMMGFLLTSFGDYLWNAIPMGFWTAGNEADAKWQSGWTLFYWGWWIAWAPFVGMFIARISRGRTIREFVVGTLFVPTTIGFLWIGLFGGNALFLELNAAGGVGTAGIMQSATAWELGGAASLFHTINAMFDAEWLIWGVTALCTFLLATWFITSSDSGTLVITTILSMGSDNPPQSYRVVWGLSEGLIAGVLLFLGGLKALQTASIAAALPVSVILLLMAFGIVKSLNSDSSAKPISSGGASKKKASKKKAGRRR